jgi:DNA-binding response OmpR family regulator
MSTILVVDDDEQIRGWLRTILEDKQYRVEEASDGKAVLTYLKEAEPALIVLDLFMPDMDGLEVIRSIRSCSRSIKILAISGHILNEFMMCQTAVALGAHEALAKPFDAETFLTVVETLLSRP